MAEYLFPVPGSVARSLLDHKAEAGGVFSDGEAAADVMLALDRVKLGRQKPRGKHGIGTERYLATRWGWTRWRVSESLDALVDQAGLWRAGASQNQPNASQTQPKTGLNGAQTHTSNQTPATSSQTPATNRSLPEEENTLPRRRAREEPRWGGEAREAGRDHGQELQRGGEARVSGEVVTLERVQERAKVVCLSPEEAEKFFYHYENAGWDGVKNLDAMLNKWRVRGQQYERAEPAKTLRNGAHKGGRGDPAADHQHNRDVTRAALGLG